MSAQQAALEVLLFNTDSTPLSLVHNPPDQPVQLHCQDRHDMLHDMPTPSTSHADSSGSKVQQQQSVAQDSHINNEPPFSCVLLSPDASDPSMLHDSPLVHRNRKSSTSLTALQSPRSATPASTSGSSLRHHLQHAQQQLQQWQHSRKEQISHAFSQCTLAEQTPPYVHNSADPSSICSGRLKQRPTQHRRQSDALQAYHTSLHHASHSSASSKLRQDPGRPRRCSHVLSSQDMDSYFQTQASQPWSSLQAAAAGKQGAAAVLPASTELDALAEHVPDPFAASVSAHSAWDAGDFSPAKRSKRSSGFQAGHEHQCGDWQQPSAAKLMQAASRQAVSSSAWPATAAGASQYRLRHGSALRTAASEAAATAARLAAKAEGAGQTTPLCIAFQSKAAQHAEAAVQAASALAALTAAANTPAHLCSQRQHLTGVVQAAGVVPHNMGHLPASAPSSPMQQTKRGRLQRVWHSTRDLLKSQAGCRGSSIDVCLPQQAAAAQHWPQPSSAGQLTDQLPAGSQGNSSSQLRTAEAEGRESTVAMPGWFSAPASPGRAAAWQQPSHQDAVTPDVGSPALPCLPGTLVQALHMGGDSSPAQLAGTDQSYTTAKTYPGSAGASSAVSPMQVSNSTSEHHKDQQQHVHWPDQSNALPTACQPDAQRRSSIQATLPLAEDPFHASADFPLLHGDMCNVDSWRADRTPVAAGHRLLPEQVGMCRNALKSTSLYSSQMPFNARKLSAQVNASLRHRAAFVTPQKGTDLSSLGEQEFWAAAIADCVDTAEPAARPVGASGVWTPVRQPALAANKGDSHFTAYGITPLLGEHS